MENIRIANPLAHHRILKELNDRALTQLDHWLKHVGVLQGLKTWVGNRH